MASPTTSRGDWSFRERRPLLLRLLEEPLDLVPDEFLRDELDDLLRDDPDDRLRDEPDDRFLRPFFDFDSATVDHLAVLSLGSLEGRVQLPALGGGPLTRDLEPFEQLAFLPVPFLLAELPLLFVQLELEQLALDPVLVVQLPVRLLGELLGNPGGPAHRRQGKQCQLFEQAHAQASTASSTKL
jgi:hypothetical protein